MTNGAEVLNIYEHLVDKESKAIFFDRLLYSLSGNPNYIQHIILSCAEGKWLEEELNKGNHNYLFGAGVWGHELVRCFPGRWKSFIDNNPELYGKQKDDLQITGLGGIEDDARIFISTRLYYKQIEVQLREEGVLPNNIINVGAVLDDMANRQYFDLDELYHAENEVFIDAGCLDGKTGLSFVKWSGSYKKIICFEADSKNHIKIRKNLDEAGVEYELLKKGIWSSEGELSFSSKGNGSSRIDPLGDEKIPVSSIDKEVVDYAPTFIKMDIEGAEYEALVGAELTIKQFRPKLAISVYHKPEDIVDIPRLIVKYHPDYKLFLRHYSLTDSETVLYAI